MKRAVAYCRFSSDNQREESITAQFRAIKKYCDDNDIKLIKMYKDEALSARSADRPGFLEMIEASNDKLFDYVIVHKLDRFSRDRYDSAVYKRKLKANGVKVISVLENLDGSPEAIILESLIEGMNEYYSANLSREVSKGMKENAYQAKFNGGVLPLGYDVKDSKYVINEEEAETVRLIFKLYNYGYSFDRIADELNSMGKRNKKGEEFNKKSFRRTIRNEKYIGILKTKIKGEKIEIEGAIPRILTDEVFYKAQSSRKFRRVNNQVANYHEYLLTGIIYYFDGQPMTGESAINHQGRPYYYYVTRKRNKYVRAEKIDEAVKTLFIDVLFNKHNIDRLIDTIYQSLNRGPNKTKIENIDKTIKEINTKMENIISAIVDGFKSDKLKEELDKLENRKIQLEIERSKSTNSKPTSYEDVKKYVYGYKKRLDDVSNLKFILRQFIERITINQDETISVTLKNIDSSCKSLLVERITVGTNLYTPLEEEILISFVA